MREQWKFAGRPPVLLRDLPEDEVLAAPDIEEFREFLEIFQEESLERLVNVSRALEALPAAVDPERAKLLGGTFDAGPGPGGGWTVEATLPRRAATP